ncbi:MAG: OmpA family protein [Lutibacter sp.]|nr:OmpA family protein [Lutibacter sp.]
MVFETNADNDVIIEKTITLSPKKCKQKFEVIVFNKQTNQQLKNTKISIYSNNNLLDEKYIVNTNTLIFNADCNTNYKIISEAENFESDEIEFTTDLTYDASSTKQLFLTPKPCNQNLLISIFNKETKEPLFGSKLIVYKNNEILKTHSLLNDATFNLELSCDTNYNLKIELEKFDTQQFEFQTTNIYNSQLVKDIYLTPSIEYVTLGGQKLINTNNIYFDLDKDNIRPDAAIELNKVISYLINNPEVKIEVKSHTDSRAPDNYNLKLSEGRAASVMSYIISKGIDASRVTGKGYGETQLINNCANGVKCTEAEHQLNRRTEFVIIE